MSDQIVYFTIGEVTQAVVTNSSGEAVMTYISSGITGTKVIIVKVGSIQNTATIYEKEVDDKSPEIIMHLDGSASWKNGNTSGSLYDGCSNCIAIATNEPTTIKLYYQPYENNYVLTQAYQGSNDGAYLSSVLSGEGGKTENVSIWNDNNELKERHIFLYEGNMQPNLTYFYIFEVVDESGNKTKLEFNNGHKWSWGSQIKYQNQ